MERRKPEEWFHNAPRLTELGVQSERQYSNWRPSGTPWEGHAPNARRLQNLSVSWNRKPTTVVEHRGAG
eukprot:1930558-Lingulodinium_polyedra.AAC.1